MRCFPHKHRYSRIKQQPSARGSLHVVMLCFAFALHALSDMAPAGWKDAFFVSSAAAAVRQHANIAVIGDSLVSGYRLPKAHAYPAQLESILKKHDYNVSVANFGRAGDTTKGGGRRLDNIPVEKYDVIILVLGGNDMLRGKTPAGESQANLDNIIRRITERNRDAAIILAGMKAHPGHPNQYRQRFDNIYPVLSAKYDLPLYPFILNGVYGKDALMQYDHVHPNKAGVTEMAKRTAPIVARTLNTLFSNGR